MAFARAPAVRRHPRPARLTGDLVNRGPASLEVLREVRALGNCTTAVLGNHDLHLLAMAWAPATVRRREPELLAVLDAPDAADLLSWLASRPLLHRDASPGWTLIHAGLPPHWTLRAGRELRGAKSSAALRKDPVPLLAEMYGDQPGRWSPGLAGTDRLRFTVNCLTRLRFVDRRRAPAARIQGYGCQPRRPAQCPGSVTRHGRPGMTRSSSATGLRSDICRSRACAAWIPVASGAARSCALRLDREEEPLMLPCKGSRRYRLITAPGSASAALALGLCVIHRLDASQHLESKVNPIADELVRNAVDAALDQRVRNFGRTRSWKSRPSRNRPCRALSANCA